jgi:hypothetical protein
MTTVTETIKDSAGVMKLLSDSIAQLQVGSIDSKLANAVGYLASVLLRAIQGHEMEARLEALERLAEQQRGRA